MRFVLEKHQKNLANAIQQYRAEISEIEGHLRLLAMASDVSDRELELVRRLKNDKTEILYRSENLSEAFKAIVGETRMAAE
jgi:prefoldin subunit 5